MLMNTYEKWKELEEDRAFWAAKKVTQKSARKTQKNAKQFKKVTHEN